MKNKKSKKDKDAKDKISAMIWLAVEDTFKQSSPLVSLLILHHAPCSEGM